MRKINVGFSSRVLPDYRTPVYKELSKRNDIFFKAYFGKGTTSGAYSNANNFEGINYSKLFTVKVPLGKNLYRVWHPTLFFYLVRDDIDIIITEGTPNMFNNISSYIYAKIFKKKFITYEAADIQRKSIYRKLLFPVEYFIYKYADAFITYNSAADRALIKRGIPRDKIFRSQNTVDISKHKRHAEAYLKIIAQEKRELTLGDHFIINYTGAIERRKKIEILLKAYKILFEKEYKVSLFIVGDGPDFVYYNELAKKMSLEKIFFWGRKIDDVYKYFLLSDICVLPGQGGLLINDAFTFGKPIIATEEAVAGGDSVYDYIENGINGYVISQNSVDELVVTLEKIITNKELYTQLCQGSSESSKKFSISAMVDGIEDAIQYVYT